MRICVYNSYSVYVLSLPSPHSLLPCIYIIYHTSNTTWMPTTSRGFTSLYPTDCSNRTTQRDRSTTAQRERERDSMQSTIYNDCLWHIAYTIVCSPAVLLSLRTHHVAWAAISAVGSAIGCVYIVVALLCIVVASLCVAVHCCIGGCAVI